MPDLRSYTLVASEYYDEMKHPTCANFRFASRLFLKESMELIGYGTAQHLEVGAGASLLAEILSSVNPPALTRAVITDASVEMLRHSLTWLDRGASLVAADSLMLPFRDDAFDTVVSSLGDPYNCVSFWREAARVLTRNGRILFTSPAYEWATTFRGSTGGNLDEAEFLLTSGQGLAMPSFVRSKSEMEELVDSVGLRLERYELIRATKLPGKVSPKLAIRDGATVPVVEGYVFGKQ